MIYKSTQLLFALTLVLSIGCDENNSDDEMFVQTIDDEFMVHVESFINEGDIRGQTIDLQNNNVEIIFGDLDSIQSAGLCTTIGNQGDFLITIDREAWENRNAVQQENLIYHELGHCFLGRSHLDDLIELGNVCTSIMSTGGSCFRDLYDERWSVYYLDELFEEGISEPEWNRNSLEDPVAIDQVLLDVQDTTLSSYVLSNVDISAFDGYEVALSFSEQTRRISFYLGDYLVHLNLNISESFYVMDTTGIDFPLQDNFSFPAGFVSSQAVGFSNKLYYFEDSVLRNNLNADFSISIRIRVLGESVYFYINDKQFFVRKNNLPNVLNFEIPVMTAEELVSINIVGLEL